MILKNSGTLETSDINYINNNAMSGLAVLNFLNNVDLSGT